MKTRQQINEIDNWLILSKIGEGSFGQIFQAINKDQEKQQNVHVAIKTQSITNVKQMLLIEYRIYSQFSGEQGFPKVFQYSQKEHFSYLVMEKLDITLDKYAAQLYPKSFVPKDCLLTIMNSSLHILKAIHKKGYIYRDLKPSNYMLRVPYNELYIIDFGLKTHKIKSGQKIGWDTTFLFNEYTQGNMQILSDSEQSRRDDIQSWAYTMLFLAVTLPWQEILSKTTLSKQEQYNEIGSIKHSINWQKYIKNNPNVPQSLISILDWALTLQFQQQPDFQKYFLAMNQQYKRLTGNELPTNKSLHWNSHIDTSIEPTVIKKKINKINFCLRSKPIQKLEIFEKQNIDTQKIGNP